MAQLAVVLLALFGQMERTYALERAAHARAVATAKGRRVGRPVTGGPGQTGLGGRWAAVFSHLRCWDCVVKKAVMARFDHAPLWRRAVTPEHLTPGTVLGQ